MPSITVLPDFAPRIQVIEGFLSPSQAHALRDHAVAALAEEGHTSPGIGDAIELPTASHPLLGEAFARVEALAGLRSAARAFVRARRYRPGEGHPPHLDHYLTADGEELVATALVTLTAPPEGGETHFPAALPDPLTVAPAVGRLALWWTVDEAGAPDPCSLHEGRPVEAGEKLILLFFLYRRRAPGSLYLLTSPGVLPLVTALEAAARARGVAVVRVDPVTYPTHRPSPLRPGDMLYNPLTSARAERVEQHLFTPGVASVYDDPEGPFWSYTNASALLAKRGVPVPETITAVSRAPGALDEGVAAVGGFPVIVKLLGGEGGVGVIRVDAMPTLIALLDLLHSQGRVPLLMRYIPQALHWRIFLADGAVVGQYRNPLGPDGVRSVVGGDPSDFSTPAPPAAVEAARAAARALRLRWGGADVLVDAEGQPWVLEVNCPTWFGHAQEHGQDVAGGLLDALLAQAVRARVERPRSSGA